MGEGSLCFLCIFVLKCDCFGFIVFIFFSQKFFRLTALRKLSICENDLNRVPPGIANLTRLVELDISKNGKENGTVNNSYSGPHVTRTPVTRTVLLA